MAGIRRSVSQGRLAIAVTAALAAAICASVPANAAITLRDADGKKLASFKTVACKTSKAKGFSGSAAASGWKLTVRIQPFGGFGFYHLDYGPAAKAKFFVRKGDVTYSNTVKPPPSELPEEGEGGNVGFPGGGDKIGISFGTAFRAGNTLEYAALGGLASCS